jgi:tRNA(fMet)-specific endonuclease VapC
MRPHTDPIQYTIRGVPPEVDRVLRQRAARRKQSLNQVILEELTAATTGRPRKADFLDLVGRWTLDTNRLTDLFQGDTALAEWLGICDEVWVPLIVLAEIKAGFYGGTQQHRNENLLSKFLAKNTVGVLMPGRETAEQYARLFVQLKRAGTPVPDNDLWIAALALENDLVLITRDQHFERIPQLLCR